MKTGSMLAVIALVLFAVVHLLRLITGTEIVIAGSVIPQWVSIIGVLVPGMIVWLLWKESN
jgi:hypothetical protein